MVEQDFNGEFLPDKLPIWAQDKAREWLEGMDEDDFTVANVAALVVDVAAVGEMVNAENHEYLSTLRADVLAEVRRVVESSNTPEDILARLENL